MVPTWMIEELERMRREREAAERPMLRIEFPEFVQEQPASPEPEVRSTVIVIEY